MSKEEKYVIKNTETGEYFVGWKPATNDKGQFLYRKGVHQSYWGQVVQKVPAFSNITTPKIYNSRGGARKIISEFVGSSFAKQDKLNASEKVLFGDSNLAKYEIVPCTIKIVEKRNGKKSKKNTGGGLPSEGPGDGPVLEQK
jgi:hypothetical protein